MFFIKINIEFLMEILFFSISMTSCALLPNLDSAILIINLTSIADIEQNAPIATYIEDSKVIKTPMLSKKFLKKFSAVI